MINMNFAFHHISQAFLLCGICKLDMCQQWECWTVWILLGQLPSCWESYLTFSRPWVYHFSQWDRTFCSGGNVLCLDCLAEQPLAMWLLSTWNVARVTEEQTAFFLYLKWVNLNFDTHMWHVAPAVSSADLHEAN